MGLLDFVKKNKDKDIKPQGNPIPNDLNMYQNQVDNFNTFQPNPLSSPVAPPMPTLSETDMSSINPNPGALLQDTSMQSQILSPGPQPQPMYNSGFNDPQMNPISPMQGGNNEQQGTEPVYNRGTLFSNTNPAADLGTTQQTDDVLDITSPTFGKQAEEAALEDLTQLSPLPTSNVTPDTSTLIPDMQIPKAQEIQPTEPLQQDVVQQDVNAQDIDQSLPQPGLPAQEVQVDQSGDIQQDTNLQTPLPPEEGPIMQQSEATPIVIDQAVQQPEAVVEPLQQQNITSSEAIVEEQSQPVQAISQTFAPLPALDFTKLPPLPSIINTGSENANINQDTVPVQQVAPVEQVASEVKKTTSKKNLVDEDHFRKISLIGLSGPKTDIALSNSVKDLVKKLYEKNKEVIFDSKDGLGEFVTQTLQEINKKATGIYLKPYLSNEFKNSNQHLTPNAGAAVIYSNYIERIRHIIKESRIFVAFNSGGIYNLSLLTAILATSKMYIGQHKPIILFGESWNTTLEFLKQNYGFSDDNKQFIYVAKDVNETLQIIGEIEQTYPVEDNMQIEKVVDRRVEGDERDFIVE